MIGTKTSRSRTRPTRIRICRPGSHLQWDLEWLEPRQLLAPMPATPNVTMSLGLMGANQSLASGSNLAIGELGVETLKIAIPDGVIPNAKLTLALSQGLALVGLESLDAASTVGASAGSFASILQGATVGPKGSSATLNFGTISNSDNSGSGGPPDLMTLVFDVVALNLAANQNGAVANSTATMTYNGGTATASAPATIVTPQLSLAVSVDNLAPAPGDTVTFTVVLAHAPGSGVGGFNVNLSDALPAGATFVANSLASVAGQAPSVLGFSGGTIKASYNAFPLGATSTLSFQARISSSIANPVTSTNTAKVTYTSLPGLVNPPLSPYDPSDAHERTGNPADPGATLNNLAASASVSYTITRPAPVAIFESIVGPGDAFLNSTAVAIGAPVQYKVDLAIPEGTIPQSTLSDLFSSGLAIQSLDAITADPGLSTSSAGGFAGVLAAARINVGSGGSSFQLNFGTLTNHGGGNQAEITLTFTAVVLDTAGNQTGTALSNVATFTDAFGSVQALVSPVQVGLPDLGVTEIRSASTGNAGGAPITFTVVVAHTIASAADAFDVVVNDVLPSGFKLVSGSLISTAGAVPSALVEAGNTVTATYADLPLGSTSTLSFQATLAPAVAPGEIERNTINVTYTTLPGDVTVPQSLYNGQSTERTGDPGDPGGTVNDLSASATVSVTVNGASLAGNVYVDSNNDGVLEQGETPLGGVLITLSGIDDLGNPVTAMTSTASTGAYLFRGLRAGTYALAAGQPAGYVAGKDSVGNEMGGNPAPNQFAGIVLGSGAAGLRYNFGERPTALLALGLTVDDLTPNVGQQVTYTLTIRNTGPNDATGVVVAAPLPSGLKFVSATPSTGLYDDSTGAWTIAGLANGATATLTLTAGVDSPAAQALVATITGSDQADASLLDNTASVAETPQASALAVTARFDQDAPNVGDTIHYLVTLTNNGPDTATNVVYAGALPPGLVFGSAITSAGSYNAAAGGWTVGTLAPGASVDLTVGLQVVSPEPQMIVATVTADQYDPTPAAATATVIATPQVADLALTSSISNATPNVGDTIQGSVTLTDNGPAEATGIVVTIPLPKGLTFQSAAPSQGTFDGNTGVWNVGSLAPGPGVSLSFIATVPAADPQTIKAAVTRADQYDPVSSNNTTSLLETPQQADLKLTETVSDAHPNLGDTISLTTTLVNNGPDAATNVVLRSLLPAGLTLLTATPSQGKYDPATGLWSVGSVDDSGNPTLVLSARVGNPAPVNVAATVVASDQYDPFPGNNSSTTGESIQVADLELTETVSDPTPTVGETVTYTVNVSNSGPDDATNVTARVPLPAGLTFATAVPSQGSYDPTTGIWTLGSVARGVVPTLTLTVQVAVDSTETTTAAISTVDQYDPNPLAFSQSVTVTPQPAAVPVQIEVAQQFVPVIGTLITGSSGTASATVSGALTASTASSGSGSGNGAGDSGDSGTGPGTLSRGQARSSASASGTKASHTQHHAHPSPHPSPHAAAPSAPIVVILPENALAIHAVAAPPGAAVAHGNAAGAAGVGVAGGLPAQPLIARAAAIPLSGGPTPVQDLNAPFAATNDTGAVGTTMKVITFIQAQRIWSRGTKSHHHGARRRFR